MGLDEKVTVTGEAEVVNTRQSSVTALVDQKQIRELPLNGRDFSQLTLLQAGVTWAATSTASVDRGMGTQVSVAGARPNQISFQLDGTDVNTQGNGSPGSAAGGLLGVETVREFQVLVNNYSAEYGRSTGGIVTRRHALGHERPARQRVRVLPRQQARLADATSTIGRQRRSAVHAQPVRRLRRRAARQGQDVLLRELRGAAAGQEPRPTWPTCRARIHATASTARSARSPAPTSCCTRCRTAPMSERRVCPRSTPSKTPSPRARTTSSARSTTRSRTTSRSRCAYSRDHATLLQGQRSRPLVRQRRSRPRSSSWASTSGSSRRRCSTRVKVAWNRAYEDTENVDLFGAPTSAVLFPNTQFPAITITGLTSARRRLADPDLRRPEEPADHRQPHVGARQPQHQDGDLVHALVQRPELLVRRRRQLRVLVDQELREQQRERVRGTDAGFVHRAALAGKPDRALPAGRLVGEAQLHAERRPALRVHHGAEGNHGKMRTCATCTTRRPTVGQLFVNPSLKNFAPRVGFAWDVTGDGKNAVHGGGGYFFEPIMGNVYRTTGNRNPPFYRCTTRRRRTSRIRSRPSADRSRCSASTCSTISRRTRTASSTTPPTSGSLPRRRSVTVGFVGSRGFNQIRNLEWNQAIAIDRSTGQPCTDAANCFFPANSTRRNPTFGSMRLRHTDGESWYKGFIASANRRFSGGLALQASYTLGQLDRPGIAGGRQRRLQQRVPGAIPGPSSRQSGPVGLQRQEQLRVQLHVGAAVRRRTRPAWRAFSRTAGSSRASSPCGPACRSRRCSASTARARCRARAAPASGRT